MDEKTTHPDTTPDEATEAKMLRAIEAEPQSDSTTPPEPSLEERLTATEQQLKQTTNWALAEEKQKLAALAQAAGLKARVDELTELSRRDGRIITQKNEDKEKLEAEKKAAKDKADKFAAEAARIQEELEKALKEEREIKDQLREELDGEEQAWESADKRALNWFRATLVAAVLATLAIMVVVVMVYYDTTSMSPEPTVSSEVIQEEPVVRENFPARVEEGEASVQKAQPAPAPVIKKSFGRNKAR